MSGIIKGNLNFLLLVQDVYIKLKLKRKMQRGLHKTDIEEIMQKALEKEGIKAVPQFPIRSRFGYILDFAIPELKIDIECDGAEYHKIGNAHDRKRNWFLRNKGWKIIRFRGEQIKNNVQLCIKEIKNAVR